MILILPNVLGADANEYLNEFNEVGEKCQIIDVFEYQITSPRIWDQNYYSSSVPVFYNCYSQEGENTIIIFDIYNQAFLEKEYISELIDLAYIKANLNNNVLSEYHFVSKGVDICNYFGADELNQESVNLVAQTAQAATPLMSIKTAKDVTEVIKIGKNLKVIGQFNPTNFIVGVGCGLNNKILKESVETLAKCNTYLFNIRNNIARKGYVAELDYCITDANIKLKKYIDDELSKLRDAVNQASNAAWGILRPFIQWYKDALSGSTNPKLGEIKIEETEMDIVKRIASQISDDTSYLYHPNKAIILSKHLTRIESKTNQYNSKYNLVMEKYDAVNKIEPSFIEIMFVDIFKNPDYNISLGKESLDNASKIIGRSKELFKQSRFNSAIDYINYAEVNVDTATEIIVREENIQRVWDNGVIVLVVAVAVFAMIGYMILRRNKQQKEYFG